MGRFGLSYSNPMALFYADSKIKLYPGYYVFYYGSLANIESTQSPLY